MKPLNGNNYGSIPHLSSSKLGIGDHFIHEGQERILTEKTRDKYDLVLAFEKYDGSNIGIAKVNGQIFALTRSGYIASTSPYLQHHIFSEWVRKNIAVFKELLKEGERITGEWLLQAHGIFYNIKNDPIIFFDLFVNGNKRAVNHELETRALKFDLPLARKLHEGSSVSVTDLLPILNKKTEDIESVGMPEGIIYRIERKGKVDFLAKWVRSDFEAGKFCINKEQSELIYNATID